MTNYFYITGTSRGIGKALTEKLLETENNFIYGISRNNFILHPRYEHIRMDLSNLEQVKTFEFTKHKRADKIVLINNAATLGEIFPFGELDSEDLIHTYHLNLIAPTLLMNKFIKTYSNEPILKQILNISSGAGRHSIPSWAGYCASKAGLDMITQVADNEQNHIHDSLFQFFSVAPGLIDTQMQQQIRDTRQENFRLKNQFIMYKEKNMLQSAATVAEKLVSLLENLKKSTSVCITL